MRYKNISGTILIYTMVLVILGVFMATVILNVAAELSNQYEVRSLEMSLINRIQTKSDLSMKYARNLNSNGNGFIDAIGCPDGVTMSGSSSVTSNFSTTLRNELGTGFCQGTHNGDIVKLYFNSGATDLEYAQFKNKQAGVNASNTSNTFGDLDNTSIDVSASYPLSPDLIDDDFDSDNYQIYSTESLLYPDIIVDDDVNARLKIYGYVIENSGPYNVFWSYSKMQDYIDANSNNSDVQNTTLSGAGTGYLYFDINASHRITLYQLNKQRYNEIKELRIDAQLQSNVQSAGLGYLQDDLTFSGSIGDSIFTFDFNTNDYAIFVENTSEGALLYQITGEDAVTGSGMYINPLQDNDVSLFSYLGNHMIIDEGGRLIGTDLEVFGLK